MFWKFGSKIFTNNTVMTFQTQHTFSILVAAILKVANDYAFDCLYVDLISRKLARFYAFNH